MMADNKAIIWDFDSTLAENKVWNTRLWCLTNLHEIVPYDEAWLVPRLEKIYTWNNHDKAHAELFPHGDYWRYWRESLTPLFIEMGHTERAAEYADRAVELFLDNSGYEVYEHSFAVLKSLSDKGYRHVILSNNFPEFIQTVEKLGFMPYMEKVFCSGLIGYEKPHPKVYEHVLDYLRADKVYMVGDNIRNDYKGSEAVGITPILVHTKAPDASFNAAESLLDIEKIIQGL